MVPSYCFNLRSFNCPKKTNLEGMNVLKNLKNKNEGYDTTCHYQSILPSIGEEVKKVVLVSDNFIQFFHNFGNFRFTDSYSSNLYLLKISLSLLTNFILHVIVSSSTTGTKIRTLIIQVNFFCSFVNFIKSNKPKKKKKKRSTKKKDKSEFDEYNLKNQQKI